MQYLERDSTIDSTGTYRYSLWRLNHQLPTVAFIMLNPSTADHLVLIKVKSS